MKTVRIRETFLPAIDAYNVVDVTVHETGVSLFKYDKHKENASSEYIVLTRDEVRQLAELLKEVV